MRTQTVFSVTVMVAVGLSASVMARKPIPTTPVTSIIGDYDSGVAPALQIQSDKLGAYTNSRNLISDIITNSTGTTWGADSYYVENATRTFDLNFTQPIAGTGPNGGDPTAPPSGNYIARVGSECDNYNNSMWTLPPGQTMVCPMNVHFDYGGRTYDLHMAALNPHFLETNSVNVTCIFPTSGMSPCSQWRLWPSGIYTAPDGTMRHGNVANLSYETTVNRQIAYVKQGDFYISFSIIVINP